MAILTDENPNSSDIVINRSDDTMSFIPETNRAAMPLRFTLLFPRGDPGWEKNLPLNDEYNRRIQISAREFYNYHIMERPGEFNNHIQKSGRIFQEFVCMSWIIVENNKLNYLKYNQTKLRADNYNHVTNAQGRVGRPIVLPSSHTGSPRWYQQKFQNGLAICREYRKPDFFITMTCNPNWPEIQEHLLPGMVAQDRPDITSRVFNLKKGQLMDDLKNGQIFVNQCQMMQSLYM